MNLKDYIASIQDFPKEGILFRDITPLLNDPKAYKQTVDTLAEFAKNAGAEVILGPESRGFMFGCPVAIEIGAGFVPVRKPSKLPRETISEEYDLEYGSNTLSMHKDAIKKGDKVVIVDDLLATGGTVLACAKLVERLGGEVVGCAFYIELTDLPGRKLLEKYEIMSLLRCKEEL